MKANTNKLYIHHQEMLRKEADLLHELLELDELPKILEIDQIDDFNKEFSKYKGKVRSLMSAISKFRENLLTDIENNPDYIDYDLLKKSQIKKK